MGRIENNDELRERYLLSLIEFTLPLQQGAKDLATLAHVISEKGSKAIRVASDFLTADKPAGVGA